MATSHPSRRDPLPDIFVVSFALMVLEIAYTRVFSFKLYYYFTYLILGTALLGIGTGSVLLALWPRLRAIPTERLLARCCLLAAGAVVLGYAVVVGVRLEAFALTLKPVESLRLLALIAAVFAPFLFGGIVVATILSRFVERAGRLYAADLAGAALGCGAAVPLMMILTPPGCIMLAALMVALPVLWLRRPLGIGAPTVVGGLAILVVGHTALPDPAVDPAKTIGNPSAEHPVLFSAWHPVFRVDVTRALDDTYILSHDGNAGSSIRRYNGDPATLVAFDADARRLPFSVLPPAPRVLIIGAAGGHEILAALHFGASHVTAVELNPVTVSLLTTHFADFTGNIVRDPRVTLVNDEGRSFLAGTTERYDLIWFVAPDSYAAMNAGSAGAFVLSESYLYTVEMLELGLAHLTEQGVVSTMFGELAGMTRPNRLTRYLGTARAALERTGVAEASNHLLAALQQFPGTAYPHTVTILVGRTAWSDERIGKFTAAVGAITNGEVEHAGTQSPTEGLLGAVLHAPTADLAAWYAASAYDLRPVYDDAPFFWHFVRFRDALMPARARGMAVNIEEFLGERVLIVLLAIVTAFALAAALVPTLALGDRWRALPAKGWVGTYFAAIGLGFMLFEVAVMQRLTLLLGYPTYALSVTLFALLLFAGIGSAVSSRSRAGIGAQAGRLLLALTALVLTFQVASPWVVEVLAGRSLTVRIVVAVGMVAPLGLCLGSFLPLGLRLVTLLSDDRERYAAWAFGVNGAFSVVASVLSTMLAMTIGFRLLIVLALFIYVLGVAALRAAGRSLVARQPS